MKQFLLFCFYLTTLLAIGQTSVYHPFPDNNAVWNFHFQANCFSMGDGNDYYSINFSGDTLINSQTYHKLTTPFVETYSTGSCSGTLTGYKGAIRQDITAKKVFIVPPTETTEELLYDFNMQVGDTVKGYIATIYPPADTVISIDSVLVGSTYRKRWNINNCYNIYIIEGVGSTYGLLEISPDCMFDHADYSLTCFQQNGRPLYPDTITNCEPILSMPIINHFDNPDSKWYVAKTYPGGNQEDPYFVATTTTVYGFKGDTIINSEKWLKIYSTPDPLFQNNLKYRGLIRTEDNKVFYMDTLYQLDTLYDFNLNVGDNAFFNLYGGTQPTWVKVIETDSIQLNNGAYYKRLKFEDPQIITPFYYLKGVWIEGIGSIHGPLFTNSPIMFSSEQPDSLILACSFSDNQYVWQHPSYSNCYIQVGS